MFGSEEAPIANDAQCITDSQTVGAMFRRSHVTQNAFGCCCRKQDLLACAKLAELSFVSSVDKTFFLLFLE